MPLNIAMDTHLEFATDTAEDVALAVELTRFAIWSDAPPEVRLRCESGFELRIEEFVVDGWSRERLYTGLTK